jgi:hypothetical protein
MGFGRIVASVNATHRGARCQGGPNMSRSFISRSFTAKFRQAGLVLAIAVCLSTLSGPSFAYTAEAQQMCTGDAFKFCSSEIPNIPAITACMYKHRTQLSVGCRAVMDKDLAAKGKKVLATD